MKKKTNQNRRKASGDEEEGSGSEGRCSLQLCSSSCRRSTVLCPEPSVLLLPLPLRKQRGNHSPFNGWENLAQHRLSDLLTAHKKIAPAKHSLNYAILVTA